jgi:PKD repeat protein
MKKYLKKFLGIQLLFLFSLPVFAQEPCATDAYNLEQAESDPELMKSRLEFFNHLYSSKDIPNNGMLNKKKAVSVIPVVFHVIHEYGEENVSVEQIEDALRVLNEDYRRRNADTSKTRAEFKARAADMEVEFKLAKIDPNGNCTDGITRNVSSYTDGGDELVKSIIQWDSKKYLNVWVVKYIARNASETGYVLGYATLPGGSASSDGIVIRADFLGSIGIASQTYAGRVLTHEVGHWLGLLHPFEGGCHTNSNCNTRGDGICDTPPVFEASYKCPTDNNTCSSDSPDENDMTENYMDYANGVCQNAFTNGQKTEVLKILNNNSYRRPNVLSSNHIATGINSTVACAPKPDFHIVSRNTVVCPGSEVEFEDLSWNGDVSDRTWTFEGGTPSVSTFENPKVTYSKEGSYKVTLKVTNAKGSNTITKTAFITVLPAVGPLEAPVEENMEDGNRLKDWTLGTEGIYGWKIETKNSFSGTTSLRCNINAFTPTNTKFSMITPAVDMTALKGLNPKLSFKVAYSLREANAGELLAVYASSDCGNTWSVLKGYVGSTTLSSKSGQNPDWVPSSPGDWKTLSADINKLNFDASSNLLFKFDITSRAGNSIFIDDINIGQYNVGIDPFSELDSELMISPNPSTGDVRVQFSNTRSAIDEVYISDLTGRTIIRSTYTGDKEFDQSFHLTEAGVYFVKIGSKGAYLVKKLIIAR